MKTYTYTGSFDRDGSDTDNFSISLSAGNFILEGPLRWPTEIQEQYDTVERAVNEDRDRDPLVGPTEIIRDYDLLDYYVNTVPSDVVELQAWWQEQTLKPTSLRSLPTSTALSLLLSRKTEYSAVKKMMDLWKAQLHWQWAIDDSVVDVIPGAWFRNQDEAWAIRFVCEQDYVAKDMLDTVTIEIEVYEND